MVATLLDMMYYYSSFVLSLWAIVRSRGVIVDVKVECKSLVTGHKALVPI